MYTTQEQRLRRKLDKLGYSLHKWRNGYYIADVRINGVVAGGGDSPLTVQEVEDWLERISKE